MQVRLDEDGLCMPDVCVEQYIRSALDERRDIHVGNVNAIDCLRALLNETTEIDRPQIDWVFYGRTVHFDKDMRSEDAWFDEVEINSRFLERILYNNK